MSVSIVCPGPVESEIAQHAVRVNAHEDAAEGKKMETARCSYLMAKGIFHRTGEMWISPQPYLAFAYLNQWAPWLFRQIMTKVAGPQRVRALKEGGNVFDAQVNL